MMTAARQVGVYPQHPHLHDLVRDCLKTACQERYAELQQVTQPPTFRRSPYHPPLLPPTYPALHACAAFSTPRRWLQASKASATSQALLVLRGTTKSR